MKYSILVQIPELDEESKMLIKGILGNEFFVYFDKSEVDISTIDVLLVFRWEGVMDMETLKRMSSLKLVQSITAGVDHLPIRELEGMGINVMGAPGANSMYIAEHALGMMLCAIKKICVHDRLMRKGEFHQEEMHRTLFGKNLLILGFGTIGQEFARIVEKFRMNIRVFKKRSILPPEWRGRIDRVYISKNELDDAWPWADYILIALPLNDETQNFIGAKELELMKRDALIVNISRGKIIDEEALYNHLRENVNFFACIDTWWVYPSQGESFSQHFPFQTLSNVLMTPHVAPKVPGFFENMVVTACKSILKVMGLTH